MLGGDLDPEDVINFLTEDVKPSIHDLGFT